MSKAPAFQFYVKDWRNDVALRLCSPAARGAWMDILCLLHDSEEYGVLRVPLKNLADAAGVPLRLARELADKRVLKGGDRDVPPFEHAPTHAGKRGAPVLLVDTSDGGPCWYSKRFVVDEWRRTRRGADTRFTTDRQPNGPPADPPTGPPTRRVGGRQGDGPASAVASASTVGSSYASMEGTEGASPDVRALVEKGTRNGMASKALREAGVTDCTPSRPELAEALDQGLTLDELLDVAREFVSPKLRYVIATAAGRRRDAASMVVPPKVPAQPGPVAGHSPKRELTAQEKLDHARDWAQQMVDLGQKTRDEADAYVRDLARKLGLPPPSGGRAAPSKHAQTPEDAASDDRPELLSGGCSRSHSQQGKNQ